MKNVGQCVFDPAEAADLRRRRRRETVELILNRSAYLPDRDRLLIEGVFGEGHSVTELSALTGEAPRTLRRRVRRIVQRMVGVGQVGAGRGGGDKFLFVVRHMDNWAPTRRRVAEVCVLEGLSLRQAADRLGLSLYAVRRHHEAINAQLEAITR